MRLRFGIQESVPALNLFSITGIWNQWEKGKSSSLFWSLDEDEREEGWCAEDLCSSESSFAFLLARLTKNEDECYRILRDYWEEEKRN